MECFIDDYLSELYNEVDIGEQTYACKNNYQVQNKRPRK